MQGNFIMLQKDDLKQVVSELVEELVWKKPQADLTPEESDEYFTRDQVCERLHITYTTLGGCNLYSKKEIFSLLKAKVQTANSANPNV